jgi:heme-degrading monooxygenase HmoA
VILEVAILDVRPGEGENFQRDFAAAQKIISNMPGYIEHDLQHCVEDENRYILLVRWETLEHHTVGFRESPQYLEWKKLLHHYYDPFPVVQHYESLVF